MTIADRILDRMREVGVKPAAAAEALGLSIGFFSDLKRGKKKSLSAEVLPPLATLLKCDVRYLLGISETPDGAGCPDRFALSGTASPDAWFPKDADPWAGKVIEVRPDPRYPTNAQMGFVCQHGREDAEIPDGAVVICNWTEADPRPGDVIVAERERGGFIQRICGKYSVDDGRPPVIQCAAGSEFDAADFTIRGRITRIVQML